ncbi:PREDICTED: Bardet-Biedl syndrome 10 protein [Nanorana parkeri]|uniref:Bardet-Biedl syndrome 10 protein n=1 Tax=Nanorana parkeri TaxID=125878 RepID=UPI000854D820|nr:PREDICTED: Bardet-Biedl syndrome 10 protein [Nanorana parkeri]
MHQHIKPLDISKILQVAESLENTICRCFGPEGGQVLFIKSTGELIITKDGKRILEYLLLDHPVARIIVDFASKHYSVTGDGVKSFVLLLCAFLREIQRAAEKNEDLIFSRSSAVKLTYKSKCHVLRRISDLLLTFQSTVLEPIIKRGLRPHFLSVYTDMKGNVPLCRASLQQTLDTYFCGRSACNNQSFISRLACDYLYKCLFSADGILDVVSFVDRCFSELHTQVPGFAVDNSRILPGLVLHRDFSIYCPVEGDLQAIIVTDQIHQSLSAPGIGFVIVSDIQLQISQQHLEQRTEHIMKQLQDNHIKLILSSVKQHEIVNFYAKLHGISIVECIPSEDIDLLCIITGVTPVCTPLRGHLQNNSFLVKTCQPVLLGDKKYLQLVFSGSLAFKPHSIVLYGPIRGLTEQIASSFHGAFKMLKQLFQPVDASWEQPLNNPDFCKPNRRSSMDEQRVTCSNCQNDSDCCDCHLQRMDQYTPIQCTHNVPGDISEWAIREPADSISTCSQSCTGTYNMCLHQLEQSLQQAAEAEPSHCLANPQSTMSSSGGGGEQEEKAETRGRPWVPNRNGPRTVSPCSPGRLYSSPQSTTIIQGRRRRPRILRQCLNSQTVYTRAREKGRGRE